ncbi:MAG TPA: glycosyltransferase family 4 protein [Candidatus Limnocylindria bacterium]|nr:glycosyltransferase family 4 protein [Candidatus Limnocylindria bacterium]
MRIGLVCPYNICLGGGVQESVIAAQQELQKRGHEVYIITPLSREARENPPAGTILVGAGTDVRSPFSTTAQISASINPDELERIVDEYQFDILHFHEPWVPVLSRQLLGKSKSVNIATFHARMPDGVMTKTIERVITPYTKSILKTFDALTAVSDAAAQYVQSLTSEPIEIIPNGIDLKKYRPKRSRSVRGKRTILYIGRLERRKGLNLLLDAFAWLNDPECRLILAGSGPDRDKLEAQAASRGLTNVEFLGYVSEAKKIRLLREASVFCSPAVYGESFGIVLLEAMASGVPIVAGDNPGYASVMQGRGLISLVNPEDTDQFARRLALLLYDDELASLWRKWALNYVKQFDYPLVVDKYEALYKRLLKS